jgi:GAF domain-containing protein
MKVNFSRRLRGVEEYRGMTSAALSAAAAAVVCAYSIFAGRGSHDLIWMVNLAAFTLANLQTSKGLRTPFLLAAWMIGGFAATGLAEMYGALKNPYSTDAGYILFHSLLFAAAMTIITAVLRKRHSLLQTEVEEKDAQIKANDELREINRGLEAQVEERAQELIQVRERMQEQSARLKAVAEISQEIASAVEEELQSLLDHIVGVVGEKLGYDHVGLFLLNESRQYAVLRAANSEGGKRMLERRHQLRVGGTGIVGYVSQSGLPRIALDTGRDAVFFNNPDLPQTRSEMALPLKRGSRVIGALDIQSNQPSAFREEDAILLGALSNQIALTIDAASAEAERDKGITRRRLGRKTQGGYAYSAEGAVTPAAAADTPLAKSAVSSGETVFRSSKTAPAAMAVPVKFRDQVIGVIQVESAEQERAWTENEISLVQAIAERAAFALENARLFEETSRRAEQEQAIARVASQIGSSTDFDRILQITVEELGRTLGAARAFIQLEPPVKETDRLSQLETD